MQTILGGVMIKKTKKLQAASLPDFKNWQDDYYKNNPAEIALLEKELVSEFNNTPNMPVEVLLGSLRRISELYGMAKLARQTKLNRESLYRALSKNGNPTVRTLDKVAACMGYKITLTPMADCRVEK